MSRDWCSPIPAGIRMAVQIAPNAKKTEVIGLVDDALKLKLHAPPVDGKANEALIRFIAESLSVPKSAVSITHGFTSKRKLLEIRADYLTIDAVKLAFGQE
ncbi:MAG: DUF167 domain-containing protein [Burkholderiaceae bacterium]|nr:DUF167 domain-containing protein [Burkholderiaceae bacterium]